MSLVRKYFLSSFSCKNISACGYLFKDNWMNCGQYSTFLNNSPTIQSNICKCKRLEDDSRRAMSALQSLRETNLNFVTKVKSFAENFPTYLPFLGQKYKKLGYSWFRTLDEVVTEDFFTVLKLPDTYYSRFKIIELHVWMLLSHLPKDGRINQLIRLGVMNAMWEDSQKRAKLVAEININYRSNFRDLYGEFLFAQMFYDYCFSKSDATLGSAVWCSFFNKENVDPILLEALVCYIRFQMHHLSKLNLKELNMKEDKGRVWAPAKPQLEEILKKS